MDKLGLSRIEEKEAVRKGEREEEGEIAEQGIGV